MSEKTEGGIIIPEPPKWVPAWKRAEEFCIESTNLGVLLPCPFCGHIPSFLYSEAKYHGSHDIAYSVGCCCGASTNPAFDIFAYKVEEHELHNNGDRGPLASASDNAKVEARARLLDIWNRRTQ